MNLGRYEVVRELGKGAMGVVYLAKDPLIGRLVALKTIRMNTSVDEEEAREFQQRFVREAQAAGILSHTSIVTVHDIGQDTESGTSFIAMEYVEGPTLKEVMTQGRPVTFDEIAEIIAQVAEALDYAHARGIVHRDVKPANIIVCGTDPKVKITDFGIAKIASSVANLTTTGQFLGTPNYMAPEQIKGAAVDGRTDIFSLGIVLYECLTRRKPFGGDSLTTISYKIVHEAFPPLSDVDPAIPEAFDAVVARALSKDPAVRYQRGRDMAAEVRAAVRGEVFVASDPIFTEKTMTTRDTGRIPTIELPFPDADQGTPSAPGSSRRGTAAGGRATSAAWWRSKVGAPLFFLIVGLLVASVAVSGLVISNQKVPVPVVDARREALVNQQKKLRLEAAAFVQAGNVDGAYDTLRELQKIAPRSTAVATTLGKLEQIRILQMSERQRLQAAKEKLKEASALYGQKQYEKAIPLFEEAFHLDPNLEDAVNYLRMSREQLAFQQMRAARDAPVPRQAALPTGRTLSTARPAAVVESGRAGQNAVLLTSFKSPAADGYVLVKAGGQSIVHENLFEERRGILRRRTPRNISVSREVQSTSLEIEVWVIIPSLKIQERRILRQTFQPGVTHRLNIIYVAASRRVDILIS